MRQLLTIFARYTHLAKLVVLVTGLVFISFWSSRSYAKEPQFGPQFEIIETVILENAKVYKGYFSTSESNKQTIYFEYRLPNNYQGISLIEISGLTEGASFWTGPNQSAELYQSDKAILTFDGLVRGKSLDRISSNSEIPTVVSTHDEALVLQKLIEALNLKKIIVIGHSRGAGIAARFSRSLLRLKQRIQILAHYDLNGLVSYASESFPENTFADPKTPDQGFILKNIMRQNPDGTITDIKLDSPAKYYQELLYEWQIFESEFMDHQKKYQDLFVNVVDRGVDPEDPQAKIISEPKLQELKLKFPLLVNRFSAFSGYGESYIVDLATKNFAASAKDRETRSLQAMMRGLRTSFLVKIHGVLQKFYIPHSVLPALKEIADAGVPVTILYANRDAMVRPHHIALKLGLLAKHKNVQVVEDSSGFSEKPNPHYGLLRKVWELNLGPKIKSLNSFGVCRRAQNAPND